METRALHILLSRLDPRAAPLVTRLINLTTPPSLDATILIGVALFVISALIGGLHIYSLAVGYGYPITSAYIDFGTLPFVVLGTALLIFSPLLVAALTAIFVANDTRSESFTLLKLTNISGQALFQGYVAATLYRLRVLLAVALGAIPLYALAAARLTLRHVLPATDLRTLLGADLAVRVTYYLLLGIAVWGLNLLAAVVAVNVGLRSRSSTTAAVIAPVNVAVILFISALLLNASLHPAFSVPVNTLFPFAVPLILSIALAFAAAPYAFTARALQRKDRPVDAKTADAP
jgi:hypothetical protein